MYPIVDMMKLKSILPSIEAGIPDNLRFREDS